MAAPPEPRDEAGTAGAGSCQASRPAAHTGVRAGNLQTARQGLPFPAQLTAMVTDAAGEPVGAAWVTFRVLSGTAGFSKGARVATACSSAAGVATAPILDAGSVVGPVRVSALAVGTATPAAFTLRVVPY